ncbi:hypothetical protein QVD99_007232 [Batrachochytrium dendrobatidis]|nr:hypothetical protein QVD99_007232 [Batrachochytrium dendrobatidis]
MGDPLYLFEYVNDMIQKSTNKDEMIKVFREYGIFNTYRGGSRQMLENPTAIAVEPNTADHTRQRAAAQIIETCFQPVQTASSSIQPYDDNMRQNL